MSRGSWGYLILWEFHVRAGQEQLFERVYGADGDWARLFQRSEAYFGTELVRDAQMPLRYVTLDFWATRAAYADFRAQHRNEYEGLDARCEDMTEKESEIGAFERVVEENL